MGSGTKAQGRRNRLAVVHAVGLRCRAEPRLAIIIDFVIHKHLAFLKECGFCKSGNTQGACTVLAGGSRVAS